MKNLETYIEKVFKEYMEYKTYLLAETSKLEEVQKEIVDISIDLTEEQLPVMYFEKLAWYGIAQADLAEQKARLYFTMEAYKDLVEPPKEIKEAIEKELEGAQFNQVFAIKNGEREIVNQQRYDLIKNTYFEKFQK